MLHRTIAALSVAVVLACTAVLHAETENVVDRFTFTAANAPKDALAKDGRLQLVIKRWSTDEERKMVAGAVADPATLLSSFRNVAGIGYLQWPGGLEYTVRYARRTPRADGGADIVLVAERPVWVWWNENAKWSPDPPFTVVHLRVNKDGVGEGRIATATGFTRDDSTGIALTDQNGPALITDLRRASNG